MIACGKCIFAEIIQSQKGTEADTAHSAHQSTFLCVQTIWENTFVSRQMQRLIFIGVIGLLENGYVVGSAFVEISIFVRVHRIHLKADNPEIFPGDLTSLSNVFHVGFGTAFTGQDQNLLKSGFSDGLHLFFNLFRVKHSTIDLVMAIKTAVNTIIFTVIGNIERCEHVNAVAEMLPCLPSCLLRDLLKEREGGRRKKRCEILRSTVVVGKCAAHVSFGIFLVIIMVHGINDFVHDIGMRILHSRQIRHVVDSVLL